MSYSDYTLELVMENLGLAVRGERLFDPEPRVSPSAWLRETLEKGNELALGSEKARGEFIVAPILLQCREELGRTVQIFSGFTLTVDLERGLKGECDFILCRTPPSPVIQAPILVIFEAKKQDIELGLGQCAAQVFAAHLFNQKHGREIQPLYGCVTTGDDWQFFRLQAHELLIDTKRYYLNEVDVILGILTAILQPPNPAMQSSPAA
jgi:hypothetical protein